MVFFFLCINDLHDFCRTPRCVLFTLNIYHDDLILNDLFLSMRYFTQTYFFLSRDCSKTNTSLYTPVFCRV